MLSRMTVVLALWVGLCGCGGCGEPIGQEDAGVEPLDAGADAGVDAGPGDAGSMPDAGAEDAGLDAGAVDAGVDAGWYGFVACAPAAMTTRAVGPAFPLEDGSFTPVVGISAPRDLSFDGRGVMLVSGRDGSAQGALFSVGSTGAVQPLWSNSSGGTVAGARFLTDGHIAVAAVSQFGMSLAPAVLVLSGAGAIEGRLEFSTGFPWGVMPVTGGGFVVFDSSTSSLIVPFGPIPLPAMVPSAVNVSMASGPAPTQQRAGALSADGRHLFVVAQDSGRIDEYAVSETGVIDGASRRVYASFPNMFPSSLAFDECGNLYVAATEGMVGAVLRLPPGGGAPFRLTELDIDSRRVIAFGAGPGFSTTHLYVADAHTQVIRRIDVGIAGQPVVHP